MNILHKVTTPMLINQDSKAFLQTQLSESKTKTVNKIKPKSKDEQLPSFNSKF